MDRYSASFPKHGLVVVPDFQFGGMEHPGAILFQNSTLFLDKMQRKVS